MEPVHSRSVKVTNFQNSYRFLLILNEKGKTEVINSLLFFY